MGWYAERAEAKALEYEIEIMANVVKQIQNAIFRKTEELKAESKNEYKTVSTFLSGEIDGLKLALEYIRRGK